MPEDFTEILGDDEDLYRGIIELNWDHLNDRPSSSTFKDSKGVSVDRCNYREEPICIGFLRNTKDFFAVCKVKVKKVNELNAITRYLPIRGNKFHSEIHDSEDRIPMRGSKPKKIRDASLVVFKKIF